MAASTHWIVTARIKISPRRLIENDFGNWATRSIDSALTVCWRFGTLRSRTEGWASMIKSELVQRVSSQNPHLYQRDVENILNAILGEIIAAMARGDRVELRGFGAFSVKYRRELDVIHAPALMSRWKRNPYRFSRPARKCASGSIALPPRREALPFVHPKLAVTAVIAGSDFASTISLDLLACDLACGRGKEAKGGSRSRVAIFWCSPSSSPARMANICEGGLLTARS